MQKKRENKPAVDDRDDLVPPSHGSHQAQVLNGPLHGLQGEVSCDDKGLTGFSESYFLESVAPAVLLICYLILMMTHSSRGLHIKC